MRPPSCSVVRVAPARRCGFAGAGPAAVPPEGGAPPRPWGGGGPRLWRPCCGGCGGGGWGGRPPPAPGSVRGGGGGGLGGALWPPGDASRRPWGGGGGRGRHGGPGPGGQPSARGSAPVTRPPYRELDARAGPRRGPHLPGRCRAAPAGRGWLMVSGQWLAGCGAAGSSPRLAPPHSLPWVAARPRTSCHTVGGAWVRGPNPPPRARRLGLHLRRRLCGGWGCGGGGLCRR